MLTRMSPVHIEPTAQVARGSQRQRVAELAAANSSRSCDRRNNVRHGGWWRETERW